MASLRHTPRRLAPANPFAWAVTAPQPVIRPHLPHATHRKEKHDKNQRVANPWHGHRYPVITGMTCTVNVDGG